MKILQAKEIVGFQEVHKPRKLHVPKGFKGIHYEKLCPWQLHCLITRAPNQLIYNYIVTIPWNTKN